MSNYRARYDFDSVAMWSLLYKCCDTLLLGTTPQLQYSMIDLF